MKSSFRKISLCRAGRPCFRTCWCDAWLDWRRIRKTALRLTPQSWATFLCEWQPSLRRFCIFFSDILLIILSFLECSYFSIQQEKSINISQSDQKNVDRGDIKGKNMAFFLSHTHFAYFALLKNILRSIYFQEKNQKKRQNIS